MITFTIPIGVFCFFLGIMVLKVFSATIENWPFRLGAGLMIGGISLMIGVPIVEALLGLFL